MTWLLILLLIIHIIVSIVFAVLTYLDVFKVPYAALAAVFCMPVAGIVIALMADAKMHEDNDGAKELGVEKLTVNNEVYKSVFVAEDATDAMAVPLAEALIINDEKTKRSLMLDVLNGDTSQYVDLLNTARDDKDTEVSHYAATAMAELMKDHELNVQHYEKECANDPKNADLLREYITYLGNYIDMGLLDGVLLEMYQNTYLRLLNAYTKLCGKTLDIYSRRLNTLLALKNYSAAEEVVNDAMHTWPDDGEVCIMRLKLYSATNNIKGISDVIDLAQSGKVYLNKSQRETVEFWTNEQKKENNS